MASPAVRVNTELGAISSCCYTIHNRQPSAGDIKGACAKGGIRTTSWIDITSDAWFNRKLMSFITFEETKLNQLKNAFFS